MSRTLKLTLKYYKNKDTKCKNKGSASGWWLHPDDETRASPSGKSHQPPADIRSLRRGWFKNLLRDRVGQPLPPFRPQKQAQPDKCDIYITKANNY
ncbi:hypothetical protein DPMN_033857 [Dreissena polymorpha]|uniref:Uncharacterized protein n=1 Tax=Dreissena polymorpha TaxID=45954 RepID=A0A9D4M4E1_DREPO|nr:hypothetical protein DPMN_033857 [Dreissena polymorpha]